MGNKLGRRRQVIDEKFTRPQGLYQHKDVDHKKLRKLILDSKLAPCYPGEEECGFDVEECPICFLFYPSLNRSRCCAKGICTECFLQMKPPHSTRPTQCPFCKTCNYAVEYRGMRSKEEKGMEQVEEQRVIEAKIRMQQQELHDEEERMHRRLETTSSSRIITSDQYRDVSSTSQAVPSFNFPVQGDDIISSHDSQSAPIIRQPSRLRLNRDDQIDLDLEDLMVMEAIWLSIQNEQENDTQTLATHGDAALPELHVTEDNYVSPLVATTSQTSSPSGGLACAIAALAERQHMDRDSINDAGNASSNMLPESCRPPPGEGREGYASGSWVEVSPDCRRAFSREEGEWGMDDGSEVAEAGTSYASSDATVELRGASVSLPNGIGDQFQPNISGSILPDSFEEQMMLAMAVSLADARSRTNSQGVAWL